MGKTTGDIFDSLLWQHLRAPHWLPLKNSVRGAKETRPKNSWCLAARHLLFFRIFDTKRPRNSRCLAARHQLFFGLVHEKPFFIKILNF